MKKIFKIMAFSLILCTSLSATGCLNTNYFGKQTLSYNLGAKPVSLDPALCSETSDSNIILANFEGLMKLDSNNKAVPGIASSYSQQSDTKYIFNLRNAFWSDGKSVTARDFEYAWKRALSFETAASYAYQLFCIKNGENYNKRKTLSTDVGVRAIDDNTLEVVLEYPTPYFLEMLAQPIFMPVREDIIKQYSDEWTESPQKYIGNGPFKMISLGDKIEFTRNEYYYDAENVKLNILTFNIEENSNISLQDWEAGTVDIVENPPVSEISRLKSENKLMVEPYLGTYFYAFNTNKEPLNDKRVRKALSFAINRNEIIEFTAMNEVLPAAAYVPRGIPDVNDEDFRDVGGKYLNPDGQISNAKKLLSDAGYPDGKGFPALTLIYNNTNNHAQIAQAIKDMLKTNLNVDVSLKALGWEEFADNRKRGNYEISRYGWIADYVDSLSFLELFVSEGENNETFYSNKEYDALIMKARKEADLEKRMEYLHNAENMLMDDMPILPVFFYTNTMLINSKVKGIIKSPLGHMYFDRAYIGD
ncbi:oligopeptide-binding protein OppA precursor [Oxobacter pfennigii]|uniref:Oligopeptide-binding protein OppA n=1 Tax=Oxobacter pfennigii TaxID=36849 RepID=A0A0P8WDX7_9CLOT|nr:peptide ABC transporter substrate-binding protein [Oxobacter pfennigii]KPU45942.1 oligopeptide-binding protein OppA precursor [Oxobacter pfennigii]